MPLSLNVAIFLVIFYLHLVCSAKILGIFPAPSISHQVVFQSIWKELSLKGHEITVITPNPLNDKSLINLTEIDVSFTYKLINLQESIKKDFSISETIDMIFTMMSHIIEAQVNHQTVKALIEDNTKHYDLVITEFINPAVHTFAARFRCPLVGVTSFPAFLGAQDATGNPSHPLFHSDFFSPPKGNAKFFDRVLHTWFAIIYRYKYYCNVLPNHDKVARKYIDKNALYLGDVKRSVRILFVNENSLIHPVKANVPAIIPFKYIHIREKRSLPKDLQQQLDSASEGVIYFSLGSNVKSVNLSVQMRKLLIETFSEIPYKIIWKWENDYLPGQPNNVVIRSWLPQQDILAHPNVKLFVTQGGQQSIEEAIFNGVPLVGIPFFGDQISNVAKLVQLRIARAVDPFSLVKENLKAALIDVAENPKYRERAKEISNLSKDVSIRELENVMWWLEYAIRHNGSSHLRNEALDVPFYQYFMLDVISLILGIILTVILLFIN